MPGRVPSASGSVLRWPDQPPPARMAGPSRTLKPQRRKMACRFTSLDAHLRAVLCFFRALQVALVRLKPKRRQQKTGFRDRGNLEIAETGFFIFKL